MCQHFCLVTQTICQYQLQKDCLKSSILPTNTRQLTHIDSLNKQRGLGLRMVHHARQISQVINVVKQLTNVVCYGWRAWVGLLKVFFKYFADT